MQTSEKSEKATLADDEYYCPYCHRVLKGEELADGSYMFVHEDVMHYLYDPDYDYTRPH